MPRIRDLRPANDADMVKLRRSVIRAATTFLNQSRYAHERTEANSGNTSPTKYFDSGGSGRKMGTDTELLLTKTEEEKK